MKKSHLFYASLVLLFSVVSAPAIGQVVQTIPVNSSSTDEDFVFDYFDATLGILTGVNFSWDLAADAEVYADNCYTDGACGSAHALFELSGQRVPFDFLYDSVLSADFGWDETTDNGQYHTVETLSLSGTENFANIGVFIGVGQFLGAHYRYDEQYGGVANVVDISVNGSVTLTYHYDPVPIPPAIWLFGSGLLCLVGMARRKETA